MDKRKYKHIFTLHLFQFFLRGKGAFFIYNFNFFFISINIFVSATFSFVFVLLFIHQICFFSVMHYVVIPYLKTSNFIIFGNEQNHSVSEEPKKIPIRICDMPDCYENGVLKMISKSPKNKTMDFFTLSTDKQKYININIKKRR